MEECASCGHKAPAAEMTADLTPSWVPTGKRVCRDPGACYERRLARDRERNPPAWLKARAGREAARQAAAPRYCGTCHAAGNDDSRLGADRVHNVEGAPPEGLLADVCEAGHVFPAGDENEED